MLGLAACSPLSTSEQSVLEGQANRVVTCHQGPDCTAKWARAQDWLAANSAFPAETHTDTLLVTGQPPFYSPKSGFVIAERPQGYGFDVIDFASGCGLVSLACDPSALALRASFIAYVMEGPAPVPPPPAP